MEKYILALDQGTTSSRSILFDHHGDIVAIKQQEFNQIYPQDAYVEHDPLEIWHSQLATAQMVIKSANITPEQIAAIGITNQRETTIIWDKQSGNPIYNAIVWQDRRTASLVDQLKQSNHSNTFQNKTGLVLDAYFSGTKLKWILDNVPNASTLANEGKLLFGTVDSWLVWNLTKGAVHVTDHSNASRTLLYNLHTKTWDPELMEILDIPNLMLPTICDSSKVIGHTDSTLFGSAIPIGGIIGDQQGATFGNLCTKPGMIKNTYGTGCFLLMNSGNTVPTSHNNLLATVGWNINQQTSYCLEGSVFIGGAVTQWIRDGLEFIRDSQEIETLAKSVNDNGGVYLVPAFTGLGAPHWDQYARGAIFGITRATNRGHIARAALESIAFQVNDLVDAIKADSNQPITTLRVDGGACKNDLLMQFQADILNVVVERPKCLELTALGAAFLAGLAVGYWNSIEELQHIWKLDRRFEPNMSQDQRNHLLSMWHRATKRSLNWAKEE